MVRRICRRPVGSGDRIRHCRWAFRCCWKTGRSGFRSWTLHAALKHFATPEVWHYYRQLPAEVRRLADQKFELLYSTQENWAILVSPDWSSLSSTGQGAPRWPRLVLDWLTQR